MGILCSDFELKFKRLELFLVIFSTFLLDVGLRCAQLQAFMDSVQAASSVPCVFSLRSLRKSSEKLPATLFFMPFEAFSAPFEDIMA